MLNNIMIATKYKIIEKIKEGSFGIIYKGQNMENIVHAGKFCILFISGGTEQGIKFRYLAGIVLYSKIVVDQRKLFFTFLTFFNIIKVIFKNNPQKFCMTIQNSVLSYKMHNTRKTRLPYLERRV